MVEFVQAPGLRESGEVIKPLCLAQSYADTDLLELQVVMVAFPFMDNPRTKEPLIHLLELHQEEISSAWASLVHQIPESNSQGLTLEELLSDYFHEDALPPETPLIEYLLSKPGSLHRPRLGARG